MECDCIFPTENVRRPQKNTGHRREYCRWKSMIFRCYSKKSADYKNYGGRGIYICEQWQHSFFQYLEDVGPKPSEDMTIDRADNDKGYCPHNIRWSTKIEQAKNRRWHGKKNSIHKGITYSKLCGRYRACVIVDGRTRVHAGSSYDVNEAIKMYNDACAEIRREWYGIKD